MSTLARASARGLWFRILVALGLGGAAAVVAMPAPAVEPFSFETAFGRLPKNVMPLEYRIAIVPDASQKTLAGTETVTLQVREPTALIVLNSLNEVLHDVRLDDIPVKSVESNDATQLTTIVLAAPAALGRHTLSFRYEGKIETSPRGLFVQPYRTADGSEGSLLSTKFESVDARRMFPCWDEPAFRATFELTATVDRRLAVVSNMPIASRIEEGTLARTRFLPTPPMPTYLLEFSAGDLARITTQSDGIELGVWAVRGREADGAEALANARQILSDYAAYFGVGYPLPKLDSIAVPGGFSGAMENWGAITYNEQLLLVTPASTVRDHQAVFSVEAHEIAHQWNGDLVTMGWWDDIWLNESFASFRASQETMQRHPSWNWWERNDLAKKRAMNADARTSSHAIAQHVASEAQIDSAFDGAITYNKGQAVLGMLEGYLGADVFQKGVRGFLKAHAFSNATTADLWNALSAASAKDVGAIAASWVEQPGFPLVSARARCDADGAREIVLSAERFLLEGDASPGAHWQIPLQIRSGTDRSPVPLLVTRDQQVAAAGRCDEALSLNAGAHGFYRVAYDEPTLKVIVQHLAALAEPDKIVLLDDQWALVLAGRENLSHFLVLLPSLQADLDERVWSQISEALTALESALRGRASHAAFLAFARDTVRPVADQLGWDSRPGESPSVEALRRMVLGELGAWDDPQTVAEAKRRFAGFATDRAAIAPDDQSLVLTIVASHADAAVFDALHRIAMSATNESERPRDYAALMHVRDPELAAKAAQIALSEEIPPQSRATRLGLVIALAADHATLAWDTFTQNTEAIMAPQGRYAALILAEAIPEAFWNAAPPEVIEAWVRMHSTPQMSANIARGMQGLHLLLRQRTALATGVEAALKLAPAAQP